MPVDLTAILRRRSRDLKVKAQCRRGCRERSGPLWSLPQLPEDARPGDMQSDSSIIVKKLNTFVPLSKREQACLANLQSAPLRFKRDRELVHEGQSGHVA